MANNFFPETGYVREAQIVGQRGVTEEEAYRNKQALNAAWGDFKSLAHTAAAGNTGAYAALLKLKAEAIKSCSAEIKAAACSIKRCQNKPLRARPALPGVLPISRSKWWIGVRNGTYPQPVKLGPNTTAWRVEDIRDLIDRLV